VTAAADIYEGRDPATFPNYTASRAASLILAPVATVRAWALGQNWKPTGGQPRTFKAVIRIADPDHGRLSFQNLVELHVLSALTHKHRVRLTAVRSALRYLEGKLGSEHPLTDFQFQTDGSGVFIEKYGELIDASKEGQLVLGDTLREYLSRVEWANGRVARLFPFLSKKGLDDRSVVIDPRIQFGRPCLVGRRTTTDVLYDRWSAGEERESLIEDFGVTSKELDSALRYESNARLKEAA